MLEPRRRLQTSPRLIPAAAPVSSLTECARPASFDSVLISPRNNTVLCADGTSYLARLPRSPQPPPPPCPQSTASITHRLPPTQMLSSEPPIFSQQLSRRHSARAPGENRLSSMRSHANHPPPPSPQPHSSSNRTERSMRESGSPPASNPPGSGQQQNHSPGQGQSDRPSHCGYHNLPPPSRPTALMRRKGDSGNGWHFASCKLPSSSTGHPRVPETYPVPTICVTHENRRTSISSNLRFSRTFSTDSIDSLERQCLKEFRVKCLLMEEANESKETTATPEEAVASLLATYPSLKSVGRSRTDPGSESEASTPPACPRGIGGVSFDSSKLGPQTDQQLKRSNPDISLDGLKPRTLRDVIGLSSYQAKSLLQCWPNIYATGTSGSFATQLYGNLARRNAKAKAILQKADGVAVFSQSGADCTSTHVKLTLELIDTIIRNLDSNPASIITYLFEVGQGHKALKEAGMGTAMWDDFGDAILDGVRRNDLVRRHKELRRAWLAIIAFVTDNIKQGHCTFRASPSTSDIGNGSECPARP